MKNDFDKQHKQGIFGLNLPGILAAILGAVGMFFPWWHFGIQIGNAEPSEIYPYLIDGAGAYMVGYKRSPTMMILTILLVVCILLILFSSLIKSRISIGLMAGSGVLILLACWRFYERMKTVSEGYHMPVQGAGTADYGGLAIYMVHNWFQPGIYLAGAAGILAILAAVFYKKFWLGFK
ncbi:MAG: hypothetical protein ACYDH1_14845 [Anaerolineaceae bacterium]